MVGKTIRKSDDNEPKISKLFIQVINFSDLVGDEKKYNTYLSIYIIHHKNI
jgi:hypothetical protein